MSGQCVAVADDVVEVNKFELTPFLRDYDVGGAMTLPGAFLSPKRVCINCYSHSHEINAVLSRSSGAMEICQ